MFSENQKISGRQLNRMMALDIFAGAFMLLPKFLLHTSGIQGIYALILGTVAAVAYGGLLYYTASRYTDNFYQFMCRTWGKGLSWVVMIYFMLRFLLSAVYLLEMFSQVINRTFLTEMPERVIAALMIIVALYGVSRGIEARGRLCSILLWIVTVPIFIIVLLSLTEIKVSRIFPMEMTYGQEIVNGSLAAVTVFGVIEFVLFAAPYVRHRKKGFHFLVKAIIFGAITAGAVYLACIGVMTLAGAGSEQWPSVILMQIIRLPGRFMSRQDGVMLTFWIAAAFAAISGYIFYADEMVHQLFSGRYFKGVLVLWLLLVYGAVWFIEDYRLFEQFYYKAVLWGGLIPTVIVLLVLLAISKIRGNTASGGEERGSV